MKYLLFGLIFMAACSKKDIPTTTTIPPTTITEDPIKFTVSPDITSGTINLSTDSIAFTLSLSSKMPAAGLIYSIEAKRVDTAITTYKIDSISSQSSMSLKVPGFTIKANYNIKITITSKSSAINTSNQSVQVSRGRIYKNYLKTSTELYKYDSWFSSDVLMDGGSKYVKGSPLLVMQTAQLDINGDGLEDIITYDDYFTSNFPIPNPPPSIFMNNGNVLNKTSWMGPSIKDPHGTKVLIGDFNNDSLPDIFAAVATDPPVNMPYTVLDNCHLIFNSPNGFNKLLEFPDLGYWYSACSGDIDNDGDLDIFVSNFHLLDNGVKNRILWNDGKGNFTNDMNGIGDIPVIDQSELIDINNDGFLDLVIDYITTNPNRVPHLTILWGNGKTFSLSNSVSFPLASDQFLHNICFADLDSDNFQEIIIGGYDGMNTKFWIEVYKSDDKGKSFVNKTSQYVDNNISLKRFDHIRVQDIDKNGRLDIIAPDKKDNIRWEWNGSKFIKF